MKEIPIEDVILDEFIELLSVVYPSHKPISGNFSKKYFLKLKINNNKSFHLNYLIFYAFIILFLNGFSRQC